MILIIANARWKSGLSGSDNIYLAFNNYWRELKHKPIEVEMSRDFFFAKGNPIRRKLFGMLSQEVRRGIIETQDMLTIDFKPFVLCYIWRIIKACWIATRRSIKIVEFVYTASDFMMDSLPGFIYKLRGIPWVAGYYMNAPKKNLVYYWSQKPIKWLIAHYADVICVTNEEVYIKSGFKDKPHVNVNGGVDLDDAYPDEKIEKEYDAVFCSRFHHTKGIHELMKIWDKVIKTLPDRKLAIIGGGDDEEKALHIWAKKRKSVTMFGFLDKERFAIYRKSKVVLYTTPQKYNHFSMAPVEAMACGCPMVAFSISVMEYIQPDGVLLAPDINTFADYILILLANNNYKSVGKIAEIWAQNWDWKRHAPEILAHIRRLLYEDSNYRISRNALRSDTKRVPRALTYSN